MTDFKECTTGLDNELRKYYPHGHPDFIPKCLEEMELHSKKNKDYARGGNPLGNFNRVSEMLERFGFWCPPHMVAFIYMMKQVDAVGRMLGMGYEGEVEGVEAKLQDVSVYAKLIGILYKEQVPPAPIIVDGVELTPEEYENQRKFGMPPFWNSKHEQLKHYSAFTKADAKK